MVLGAVLAVLTYALVEVLRARSRYLRWHKAWTPERKALRALSLLSNKEQEPCYPNPYELGSTTVIATCAGTRRAEEPGSSSARLPSALPRLQP